MAYIGRQPTVGNFRICDAISVVNGQAAYTMQVGGVNVIPESANNMIVSLNGVIQKPGSSYTVSSSTITFSSNLSTGDVIDFIQILGGVANIGTPSDGTVTNSKINYPLTESGVTVSTFNRTTSDGTILELQKNGTTVGSIGAESGSLSVRRPTGTNGLIQTFGQPTHGIVGAIGNTSVDFYITNNSSGSTNAGIKLSNNNKVVPMLNASSSDNVTDLGSTTSRWKDLYLGGGAYIGGTGSANFLDDYEEGTWTGTISDGTNNATMGSNTGAYVKIGSLVVLTGYFTVTNLGSVSGNLRLIGLPFACGSSNSFYTGNGIGWSANMSITDDTSIGFQIDTNASHLNITNYDNASGTTTLQASEITGIGQFMMNLSYRTDA